MRNLTDIFAERVKIRSYYHYLNKDIEFHDDPYKSWLFSEKEENIEFQKLYRASKNKVTVRENDWFEANVQYQGQAELTVLKGKIKGHAIVEYTENCEQNIILKIESVDSNELKTSLLEQALVSGVFELTPEKHSVYWTPKFNQCLSFILQDNFGFYETDGNIKIIGYKQSFNNEPSIIKLHSSKAVYRVNSKYDKDSAYWVLPLTNFLSDYHYYCPYFDRHPLRIFNTIPKYDKDMSEYEISIAESYRNIYSHKLIAIHFNKTPGFIEALSDYPIREEKLLNKQTTRLITSVMVGDTWQLCTEKIEEVIEWIPFDYLWLLSLAKGNSVGSAWIEIRGHSGELIKRIHFSCRVFEYLKGHTAIKENLHNYGINNLISNGLESKHYQSQFLRSLIDNIITAGMHNLTVYDRLSCIFRAIDSLYSELKITENIPILEITQKLKNPGIKETVEQLISSFEEDIQKIIKKKEVKKDPDMENVLNRLSIRFKNLNIDSAGFGKAFPQLIETFNLKDLIIVNDFMKINKRDDKKKKWQDLISRYRNIVMHGGYFDFERELYQDHTVYEDVLLNMYHLHDLLLRITFKLLDYEGQYQPSCLGFTAKENLDWFQDQHHFTFIQKYLLS